MVVVFRSLPKSEVGFDPEGSEGSEGSEAFHFLLLHYLNYFPKLVQIFFGDHNIHL